MFLNPLMLAAIGTAALPVLIHLLWRARYRSVEWGAMLFLDGATATPTRRISTLKQWLLLATRAALLVLVAIALSRPVTRPPLLAPGEGRAALVIVLDTSPSMAFEENGRSRLDDAKLAATTVLASLRPGDRVALLAPGQLREPAAALESDPRLLTPRVAALQVGPRPADLASALLRADTLLRRDPASTRQILLISDEQHGSFRSLDDAFARAWNADRDAGPPPAIRAIRVGNALAENVSVEAVRLANPPAVAGMPTEVEVVLRNHGPTARAAMPLTLHAGGRLLAEASVYLPPFASQTVRQSVRLSSAGSTVLSAAVQTARLPSDDRAELAIDVLDPIDVLVITDRPGRVRGTPAFDTALDFIRTALAPYATANRRGPDAARIRAVASDAFTGDLAASRVVLLCDVADLSDAQVRALEQFVYGGGGLLVAPGAATRVGLLERLWRDGSGVLPAEPLQIETAVEPDRLATVDVSHPAFAFLRDDPAMLPPASFSRWIALAPTGPTARVLAVTRGNRALVVERPLGRGRVVLVASSLDTTWNTLPLTSFYLPMMQSLVRYLATGGERDRNLDPGDAIVAELPTPDPVAFVLRPDGRTDRVDLIGTPPRRELRYARTELPGRYVVRARGLADTPYVVRGDPLESDLTPIDAGRRGELARAIGFSPLAIDDLASPSPSRPMLEGPRELSSLFLAAAVLLGLIEVLLARRFATAKEPR
jgi:hypothetical protein